MRTNWYCKLGTNSRRAFWTSFAGFSLDAMDVQLYAFMLPVLVALWHLTHAQAGLLATVTLVSSAAGGWIAGMLADRLGRVRLLKITILGLAISTCFCGLADDYVSFLAARAFQGLCFGSEWTVGAVLVAEAAPPEFRGRMVGAAQSAWPVGWGLAAASATLIPALLPPDWGWRAPFMIGLPPTLLVFFYRTRMSETEAFLQLTRARPAWNGIFAAPVLPSTLKGCLLTTGMHGGYWAIATWWPAMLKAERGFSTATASLYFGALVAGSFLGYAFGAWLGDRKGRRETLASFALGATLLLLACTLYPVSDQALLLLSFPLGFFALGMFSVIGAVLAELYPTALRGSGLGFCYNFGRGMAGVTPLLIGSSILGLGLRHAIGLYATAAYALVVVAAFLLPETRGRELRSAPADS
ncbi:putative MFS family arabinose efflux permease [Nitrospirillum viridazoti]|uniref:MFS transporter n=2 Tax=Nitrospirillum TaxID=1543705 RepID=A0A248K0P6_9PROT|nr:MFS transporter [Nitrospirillum amazonense]ASG24547.1 MFS transporter [Nitrospirillum amazonense CBAmc]TWB37097.1 putative MFS family arabinose efflux permease [Nitrospirillum amazonense]